MNNKNGQQHNTNGGMNKFDFTHNMIMLAIAFGAFAFMGWGALLILIFVKFYLFK